MMTVTRIKAEDGSFVEFDSERFAGSGTMKDVFFSPCGNYVLAFFRNRLDAASQQRLQQITGRYRERIFDQQHGDYWRQLFCWPEKLVQYNGRTAVVVPVYPAHFFFQHGSTNQDFLKIKGKEKQGKWFASARNQNRYLDPRERGDWLSYLRICLMIARAVRRLHAAGLAHSDLSYKNVLVSPVSGHITLIDLDGLVVPGKFPPDVVGTPDFIAPEVVATASLPQDDPGRVMPSIHTDRHALAVMIYNYLLLRHPLRGGKVHAADPDEDECLQMGAQALFVEHPDCDENRIHLEEVHDSELPWKDTKRLPYTITGPYLTTLFERAFITGLHQPSQRPTADEWETALIKTIDLIQPCSHSGCEQKWYVFDNSTQPVCPFCHAPYHGLLPVINFYSQREPGQFIPDHHRLMVYSNQSLFAWHTNRLIQPNERLQSEQRQRKGYFVLHQGQWYLVNENMPDLIDVHSRQKYPPGSQIQLKQDLQLLIGQQPGDRLFHVQMVSGSDDRA